MNSEYFQVFWLISLNLGTPIGWDISNHSVPASYLFPGSRAVNRTVGLFRIAKTCITKSQTSLPKAIYRVGPPRTVDPAPQKARGDKYTSRESVFC